jgi:hypothetical protein
VGAIHGGGAAIGEVAAATETEGGWQDTEKSAGELFFPNAERCGSGIGLVIVREPAVVVIEGVARIIDRPPLEPVRSRTLPVSERLSPKE